MKRFYAKARRGEIASFTGVFDLCAPPQAPELEIGTDVLSPAESLGHLLAHVERAFRLSDVRRLASCRRRQRVRAIISPLGKRIDNDSRSKRRCTRSNRSTRSRVS